jgi:uroporphyrinogen-III synthase
VGTQLTDAAAPHRSLAGMRVLVTRPRGQARALAAAIRDAGAAAVEFPLLAIEAVAAGDPEAEAIRSLVAELGHYALAIFISTNAVSSALPWLRERWPELPEGLVCLAIGEATAAALARAGIRATHGARAMTSEELLGDPLLRHVSGKRIVIFKGTGGRRMLADTLAGRGARVKECAVYRRRGPDADGDALCALLAEQRINVVLVSSGEGLANFLGLLGRGRAGTIAGEVALVAPGERVARQGREAGFRVLEVAENATDASMMAALHRLAGRGLDQPNARRR